MKVLKDKYFSVFCVEKSATLLVNRAAKSGSPKYVRILVATFL